MTERSCNENGSFNYRDLGAKIVNCSELTDSEIEAVYHMGICFASELINKKKSLLSGIKMQSDEFIEYLEKIVLERMIKFYIEAKRNGQTEADSVALFGNLAAEVYRKTGISNVNVISSRLVLICKQGIDRHSSDEVSGEVLERIGLVSGFVSKLIPSNPPVKKMVKYVPD